MKLATVRVGKSGDYETKDVPSCTVGFLRWFYGLFGETVHVTAEWDE